MRTDKKNPKHKYAHLLSKHTIVKCIRPTKRPTLYKIEKIKKIDCKLLQHAKYGCLLDENTEVKWKKAYMIKKIKRYQLFPLNSRNLTDLTEQQENLQEDSGHGTTDSSGSGLEHNSGVLWNILQAPPVAHRPPPAPDEILNERIYQERGDRYEDLDFNNPPHSLPTDVDLNLATNRELNVVNIRLWKIFMRCAACFTHRKAAINLPCLCLCYCLDCATAMGVCRNCDRLVDSFIPVTVGTAHFF